MISNRDRAAISKRYLNRTKDAHLYIKALESRLNAFTFANITKYDSDGGTRTEPRENVQETKMIEFSELNREIEETRNRIDAEDLETIKVIEGVDSFLQRIILTERYINFLCWDDIAKRVNYSRSHVLRIHGKALLSLYKSLKEAGLDE